MDHVTTATVAIRGATAVFGKLAIVPILISALAYFKYDLMDPSKQPRETKHLRKEYDFVVIGSGSAGAVVANRLTEIPGWNVLLLEAGGLETELSDVPFLSAYLQHTKLDWNYRPERQDTGCQAMRDGRCCWPRGKVLGGSSVLNAMVYIRGNRRDYDQWESFGNPGWGYEDVLPYFKKSEDQKNPYLARNTKYHSTGGYQTIQEPPYHTPLGIGLLQAAEEMGYDILDVNGENQTGFAPFQYTMRQGSRCSTAKGFIRPIRLRKNFHLSPWSHVTNVLINPRTKRAYGVQFIREGRKEVVYARKEVILSAGAINTPQLLMLSGVGSKQHLEEMGIPVIQDSPGVGQNLQDHIAVGGLVFLVDYPISIVIDRMINLNAALKYVFTEDGPLTSSIGLEIVGFIPTKYANQSDDWPDVEYMMIGGSVGSDASMQTRVAHCLSNEFYTEVYDSISNWDQFSIFPMLLRPKSRGYVKLRSKNPLDYPLMYHNYLTHPEDVDVLREGVKAAIALTDTSTMKRFGTRFHDAPWPNCKHIPMMTDEYWNCLTHQYTMTIYHQSCTAKMGPSADPMAVVDPELRVYGVPGLRVIDASIMPTIINGNINAPTIMIGEKGADLIKKQWLPRGKRNVTIVGL